jgi:hypothetical protein
LVDDLIVQFGSIHGDNFEGLQKFSEMIQEHVGVSKKRSGLINDFISECYSHYGSAKDEGSST